MNKYLIIVIILGIGLIGCGQDVKRTEQQRKYGAIYGKVYKPIKGTPISDLEEGDIFAPKGVDAQYPTIKSRDFPIDANGEFRIDNIQPGFVNVSIYQPTGSLDLIGWKTKYSRRAYVCDKAETEVRFFDDEWDVIFEICIGNASEKHYRSGTGLGAERTFGEIYNLGLPFYCEKDWMGYGYPVPHAGLVIDLVPQDRKPISYPEPIYKKIGKDKKIVIHDVSPGTYHCYVGNKFRKVYETDIIVNNKNRSFKIQLEAGCICGKINIPPGKGPNRPKTSIYAIGKIQKKEFYAFDDCQGSFCLTYLPEDTYKLMAHSRKHGWKDFGTIKVKDNIQDIGEFDLQKGATIKGKMILPLIEPPPDTLVAVSSSENIAILTNRYPLHDKLHDYEFKNLWPGEWAIILKRGREVLIEEKVKIEDKETKICDLVYKKEKD